ncbi:M20 family peptidase [Clostridium cibarium]|uniref:Peptidase M20 domain-containing protein 2 n=1 Tax=Clostridium cibarium TaxID=2762247 RepID=A0ABR8PWW3_9CLOT|nr:M20 family peptidase [Clostridium cibarium]MBD7912666.1 M20 family peptidase [Clostridium cibarium]
MKQDMMSFLATIENEIEDLCKYLYSNPEESYKELKSSRYICEVLQKHNFNVTNEYLDITNSFLAVKGNGYPKICFLCEYDAVPNSGHITGHNALASISVGASLILGHVIDKIGGSVILIGCPGEYLGGTKATMVKQGTFDDVDVVMECHPDTITCESGTSSAITPLSVKFTGNSELSYLNREIYTSLDSILLTFNMLNSLMKGFPKNVEINSILSSGGYTPLLTPLESEAKFYIRAKTSDIAELTENKIREIVNSVSSLTHIPNTISLYEPPNEELVTNRTLNRLFSHNLKENGIIDIHPPKDISAGLSIGIVSQKVPCIHPYISIIKDSIIEYGTKKFSEETISDFSLSQIKKAALALAFTGSDLIEKEGLLAEVKNEFFTTKTTI